MILFYSERQLCADMFKRGLALFLQCEIKHFSISDAPNEQAELLIIDGKDIHPQRLKKLIRLCRACPVILLSDGACNCEAVTSHLPLNSPVKDVAEICRLILGREISKRNAQFSNIEELLLSGLAQAQSNKQIAREYGLPLSTVKYHLQNIYAKMNVNNRTQAALKLRENTL